MNACAQFLVPIGRHWLFYAPLQAAAALVSEAAAQALRDGRLDALPVSNRPALEMILANPQGDVRTMPHMLADKGGMDGFFIARFIRKGA